MSGRAVVAVGAAVAGLMGAGAAPAQAPRSETIIDARADVQGRLDVRKVTLGLTRGHRRVYGQVRMRRTWGTGDLRATEGRDGSICLRLFTKRDPDSQPPDYLVCASPSPDGEKLVGVVLRERRSGLPRRVAKARVTRPSGRAVRLRFGRRVLGRAIGVRFGAESVTRGPDCRGPVGCRDLAPDAPDTMYLDLR